MSKFKQFIALRENEDAQEIEAIFTRAAADIRTLFDQLARGTTDMVKGLERAKLPEELQNQIVADLTRVIQKIKAKPEVASEHIIRSHIKNITEATDPVSILQGVGSHGVGSSGKKSYNYMSVINNVYRQVMDRMTQLKSAVFTHLGMIGDIHKGVGDIDRRTADTHSKVLGLRTTAGNIRNRLTAMETNPRQPLSPEEADKAQDSMIALTDARGRGLAVKLVGPDGVEIAIDPESEVWKSKVLLQGMKNKHFTLVGPDGTEAPVNIGDPTQVSQTLTTLGTADSDSFVPTPTSPRGRRMRGPDGKALPGEGPTKKRKK